jgi:hypothetical protein
MEQLGRPLIILGGILVVVGLLFMFGAKLPFRLGRLPLDFHWQRGNFNLYFPLGTLILINVILAIVFGLLNRR